MGTFCESCIGEKPRFISRTTRKNCDEAYQKVSGLPNDSIYDTQRLAQPDEVWNFGRGDGIEKALLLANFLRNEMKLDALILNIDNAIVTLEFNDEKYSSFLQKI